MRPVQLDSTIRSAPKTARELSGEDVQRLRVLDYKQYLYSTWWRSRRNRALKLAGYRCQRCACKRELEVHHVSYERLGAEEDADLEVVCRGCHLGGHRAEVQSQVALYARVLSAVIAEERYTDLSDVLEEAKRKLSTSGIDIITADWHAAVSRVLPRIPFKAPKGKAELYEVLPSVAPLSRAEACEAMARLGIAPTVHHMPEVQPRTRREIERRNALRILAQAITEQVHRCEEVEREP